MADGEIRRLAFHDALTGLSNRIVLNDRLIMVLAQVRSRQ